MNKDMIQIIIVEDDNDLQEMYKNSIETFNIENEKYEIKCHHLVNDNDVPKILYNEHIDAIIIDLDWGTGEKKVEGNKLVKKIYDDCRVPIFVVSGNLHLLEEEYQESPIFKKYQRDEVDNQKLFKEIEELYKTGYTKALGNQSKIDKMFSKVFWEHMSESIYSWQEDNHKTERILRFAITRINEMLSIIHENEHDCYEAMEFYIKPSIKEKPFTGDIVMYDEKEYIVITAACDIEQNKTEFVVFCQIDFKSIDDIKKRIKESNSNSARDDLKKYINNSKARYHLLPPCQIYKGGLVDFQCIRSVSKEEFQENVSVVATINPMFHKDIQARFSHYYGRQGQPQLNIENIVSWIRAN